MLVEKFMSKGNNWGRSKIGEEVGKILRAQLCKPREHTPKPLDDGILYISTYDTHVVMIQKCVLKEWHLLQNDPKYGKLFKQIPCFVYKRGKKYR